MSTSLWDEESGELADLLGNAGVLHEATPTAVFPASIYARAGTGWSLVQLLDTAGVRLMQVTAGVLAAVPTHGNLLQELNRRSSATTSGTYITAAYAADHNLCCVLLRAAFPYDLIRQNHGDATTYYRKVVSAVLNSPNDLSGELAGFGGQPFTFDHRGFLSA
jgi:hypothetical protein